MAFRRDSEAARQWDLWVTRNRNRLLEIGVPLIVFDDERNWQYFLGHGYYSPEGSIPIFDVDRLSSEQAMAMCLFLEENETGWAYPSCALNQLQWLVGRGEHSRK
jgi:hypothetical protein